MRKFGWSLFAGLLVLGLCAGPARTQDGGDAAAEALAVLRNRCAKCHGTALAKPKNGFGIVDDLARLAADRDYVVPGKPDESELYRQVQDESMPYEDDLETVDPLPESERRAIRTWIESLGRSPEPTGLRPVSEQISTVQLLVAIHADLKSLSAERRKYVRYLTLTHLWNAGEPRERIERTVHGAVKLLNGLSWDPKIHVPEDVLLQRGVLLRVDLDALDWSAEKWEAIVHAPYPYGVLYGLPEEREIANWTGSSLACLRADWFVFEASVPPLYHALLAPEAEPNALADARSLETYLGVDVVQNMRKYRALRGGYKQGDSGVSSQNRLIERHPLPRWPGAYWKSYDFKPVDQNNLSRLVDRPLGPPGATDPALRLSDYEFRHDGGELIFNLPNGLQGYLLVDAAGKRIDNGSGITDIVFDSESATAQGSVIVNGISCMSCHALGMKEKEDTLTADLLAKHDGRPGILAAISRLYRPKDLRRAFTEDRERFLTALDRAQVPRIRTATDEEPTAGARRLFERDLSPALAAAELGFSTETRLFSSLGGPLSSIGDELRRRDKDGKAVGRLPRSVFKGEFPRIVKLLRLGTMPDLAPTPPTPPDDHDFAAVWNRVVSRPGWRAATPQKNSGGLFRAEHVKTGLVFVLLPPGEFTMGSTDGGAYERPPHRVRIGKPFLMCEMECTQGAWTKGGGTNDSKFTGARLPVEQVSWTDAREWCQRNGFRLPSEAEWEYACRAGNPGRFGFGDEDGRLSDFGWHKDNSSNRTHEVAGLKPNGWGLFDMHGNVWEWCEDRYHDDYEGAPGDGSAWVDGGTPARVFRGGSWDFPAGFCRSAFRLRWSPSGRVVDLGFRPAISVP